MLTSLLVNGTTGPGGASRLMLDGHRPEPGGWNRLQIVVDNIEGEVERLRTSGARFRDPIASGWAAISFSSTTQRAIPSNCSSRSKSS